MTRWIGRWIIGVGMIHISVGGFVFGGPLLAILRDGVWNAVDGHAGRPLAFWFVFAGFLTVVVGSLVDWLEDSRVPIPRYVGWAFLALTVVAIVALPFSGGWLLLPPALGALARSHRPRSAGRAAV